MPKKRLLENPPKTPAGNASAGERSREADRQHVLQLIKDLNGELDANRINRDLLARAHKVAISLDAHPDLLLERDRLRARALASEAFDSMGLFSEAQRQVPGGEGILKADTNEMRVPEPADVRARVRYALASAQSAYRQHRYEDANYVVEACELALASLPSGADAVSNSGLNAACAFLKGRIARQRGDFDAAEACFENAIEHYRQRSEKLGDDDKFSAHGVGLCLGLGFTWVQLLRGNLTQARHYATTALFQLAHTEDLPHNGLVLLWRASILRALAGTNKKKLREAFQAASRAHQIFEELGHDLYRARAACELALIYHYLGEGENARVRIGEAVAIAKALADVELEVEAAAIASRVERSGGQDRVEACRKAEAIATEAIKRAEEVSAPKEPPASRSHVPPASLIAALIARGVARFHLGKQVDARADFVEALRLNTTVRMHGQHGETSSAMVEGTCHVFLAWSYKRDDRLDQALAHLKEWEKIEPGIEHEALRERAIFVENEVELLRRDFVVKADVPTLEYAKHATALRVFLMRQATIRADGNKAQIAKMLGVSRQTLFEWESKLAEARETGAS